MPTLPQRDLISRHIGALDAICDRTPKGDRASDKAMLVLISKMLLTLPGKRQEVDVEAKGEAYAAALEDVPVWAVDQAIRGWYRGSYGPQHDYEWAPAPATLRAFAMQESWKVAGQREKLQSILIAEPRKEYSKEHCARMAERVTVILRAAGRSMTKPEMLTADKDYATRAIADLRGRKRLLESDS